MGVLTELLKKSFYSTKETDSTKIHTTSRSSQPRDVEINQVAYDPFTMYTTGSVNQQIAVTVQNYAQMVMKWREAALLPEVIDAVNEIVDEAIVYDETGPPIKINMDDVELPPAIRERIQDSFDKIMFMLDFNEKGEELFRQWYIDGSLTLEVIYDNKHMGNGIKQLIKLSPFNLVKVTDLATGQAKYVIARSNINSFNLAQSQKDVENTFVEEQITQITSGVWTADKKLPLSYINTAMKSINQLYTIEDALVIYRLTRAPEKRVFTVDVGNLPKTKAEEYMASLIRKFRQKKVYNTEEGTVENKNKSQSILEDYWFSQNANGKGTKVENLAGSNLNFSDMNDLNYFVDKVYKALRVPPNRKNSDGRLGVNPQVDVERDEIKFFKFINKLRRRFNNLFIDLLKKDILAKKIMTVADWNLIQENIKFIYCTTNPYFEFKNLQVFSARVDAANAATTLVDSGYFSKHYVKTNVLKLSDEEIEAIDKEIEAEKGDVAASPEMGMPSEEYGTSPQMGEFDQQPSEMTPPPMGGGAPMPGEPNMETPPEAQRGDETGGNLV